MNKSLSFIYCAVLAALLVVLSGTANAQSDIERINDGRWKIATPDDDEFIILAKYGEEDEIELATPTLSFIYTGEEQTLDASHLVITYDDGGVMRTVPSGYYSIVDDMLYINNNGGGEAKFLLSYTDNVNVGTATLTIKSPDGATNEYETELTFEITPAALDIIVLDGQSKQYGDPDPDFDYIVEGLQPDDDKESVLTGALSRTGDDAIGTYEITQGTLEVVGDNYEIQSFTGSDFVINPRAITVTADDLYKFYGNPDPTLTVTIENLPPDEDAPLLSYSITREEGETVGEYTISVTGENEQGNYEVTFEDGTFEIKPFYITVTDDDDDDPNLTITLSKNSYIYDGTEKEPSVTITYKFSEDKTVTIPSEEYEVSYENNIEVGTDAKVIITDIVGGNFTISGSKKFEITPFEITVTDDETADPNLTITLSKNSFIYDGTPKEPSVTITYKFSEDKTITIPSEEYEVSYKDNVKVGTDAKVIITDIDGGNYTINGSKKFEITPFEIIATDDETADPNLSITLSQNTYTYDGTEKKPSVTITYKFSEDKTITIPSEEYEVSYENNIDVGTDAKVIITDKEGGNFTINGNKKFEITPFEITATDDETADPNLSITLSQNTYTYDGTEKKPSVTITYKFREDKIITIPSEEYEVSYENNIYVGTDAKVIITDKEGGNFTINGNKKFEITPFEIIATEENDDPNLTITLSQNSYIYDGTEKKPSVTITYKFSEDKTITIPSSEYEVSYKDNVNVGTDAKVRITDIEGGNFTISGSKTFAITPFEIIATDDNDDPNLTITLSQNTFIYDGTPKEPSVTITYKFSEDKTVTIPSEEYEVSYENNINVGTDAKVIITDIDGGNFTISGSKKFEITPFEITATDDNDDPNLSITLSQNTFIYDGTPKEPSVTITYKFSEDKTVTIPSEEYEVSYENNIEVGTDAKVIITDIEGGNFIINGSKTFEITPFEITATEDNADPNLSITLSKNSYIYDGTPKEPSVTITYKFSEDKTVTIPTSEYKVSYKNNINVGTDAKAIITDIDGGNYTINGSKNFEIKPFEIIATDDETADPNLSITLSPNTYTYDGTPKEPSVTITYKFSEGKTVTIPSEEYKVSYKNNIEVGTDAKVIITDIVGGNYTISGSKKFEITPFEITATDDETADPNLSITLFQNTYTYDGTEKKPSVTITYKFNEDKIVTIPSSEYKVSYKDNVEVGTDAKVIITDNEGGNFTINGSKNFEITPFEIIETNDTDDPNLSITLSQNTFIYDGTPKEPSVTITYKFSDDKTITIPSEEYKVSYKDNVKVGTDAKVIITDIEGGNFTISGSKKFEITPFEITVTDDETADPNLSITLSQNTYTYDGTEKKPSVTITYKFSEDKTITIPSKEYEVSYKDNVEVSTDAKAIITDIVGGNFTINGSKKFEIKPFEIIATDDENADPNLTITLSKNSYIYDGTEKKPSVTITYKFSEDKIVTIPSEEYEVSYGNNIEVGSDAKVIITDNEGGNFTISGSKTFEITPFEITATDDETADPNLSITLSQNTYIYDGTPKEPSVTITYKFSEDETITIPSKEYTVSYENNIEVGTDAKVIITDNEGGNFTINGSKNFEITPFEITATDDDPNLTITLSKNTYIYDGTAKEPSVTITYKFSEDETIIIPSKEYTVSYENNINVGTDAKVIITDIEGGNFTINGSKKFEIIPFEIIATDDNDDPNLTIKLSKNTYIYDGTPKKPSVTITYKFSDETVTIPSKEYKITYENNINVGTDAKVIITDIDGGNFTINGNKKFEISPAAATITLNGNGFTPTGLTKMPTVNYSGTPVDLTETLAEYESYFDGKRGGYTFVGWSINSTATAPDQTISLTSQNGMTLYAVWKINQYTVYFYDADGATELYPSITADFGAKITAPDNPTKEGVKFICWNPAVPETMPINGKKCIAQWMDLDKISITFVSGTSEVDVPNPIIGYPGDAIDITIQDLEWQGHKFLGWDKVIPTTIPTENMVITAQWETNKHSIIYMVDNAEYKTIYGVEFGSEITTIDTPTKEGHTFSGWQNVPATMPDEDVTISGTFSINTYTITFKNYDGNTLQTLTNVEYGQTPEYTGETPVKTSDNESVEWVWIGWTPEIAPASKDATYVAKFSDSDIEKPIITSVTVNTLDATATRIECIQSGVVEIQATDNEKVAKIEYTINGKTNEYTSPFTLTEPGEYDITVTATDESGNTSNPVVAKAVIRALT